ncbi:MAG: hypothetical protein NT013_30955 [Planctomycetia bacterium]|nr:hypothetical protein [Planctomycetia bacterium]
MKLPSLDMPDNPQLVPSWLEHHLIGLELGEVVAELEAVHGPARTPTTLDEVCGSDLPKVLEQGLTALPREQLRRLLKQPGLLLELQERVLIDGGTYWNSLPLELEHIAAVEHVFNVLKQNSFQAPRLTSTLETCATKTRASLRRSRRIVLTAAAVVLAAFGLWLFPKPDQHPPAWGWNRPGTFAADVTTDQYLDRLADRADEWRRRPHDAPDQLHNDLTDFRQACLIMLEATHDPLPPEQRDELKKRCRKWLGKIDDHLAALDAGDNLAEVRQQADETIGKLAAAIRKRFPA